MLGEYPFPLDGFHLPFPIVDEIHFQTCSEPFGVVADNLLLLILTEPYFLVFLAFDRLMLMYFSPGILYRPCTPISLAENCKLDSCEYLLSSSLSFSFNRKEM